MELLFLGGAAEVGASCTLLRVAGRCILIDGGIRPAAREGQSRLPDLALLDRYPPEALLITHAHIDHTGALPLIASLFPHIPIYATESTKVLTEVLLRDSVRIMEQEQLGPDGEIPLYNSEQVDALLARIRPIGFRQPFAPLPSFPQLTVEYLRAGHILGAGMLFFNTPEGALLHTGDISVTEQRTIKGLDVAGLPPADVMLCEGTYGNRAHSSRKEEERKLVQTVQSVIARGGRVLCPAFAVGRAQEVTLILKAYRTSGQISPVSVYLDGMVRSVCAVYQNQSHDLQPTLQRYQTNARRPLFADPDLRIFAVRSFEREQLVARKEPMLVISSSGMLSGGASPLYAADIAQREQDCILFTGYQDEESPGAALLAAKQGASLRLGEKQVTLHCQIRRYNLSGHADAEQIQRSVTTVRPAHLILVHGAPDALEALAQRFPAMRVDIPRVGTTITCAPGKSTRAVSAIRGTNQSSQASSRSEEMKPPAIQDLWKVAARKGALRPWTSVELGQHYYGAAYRPVLRTQVERVLKEASPFFKLGRVGVQTTYLPRSLEETEQLRPIAQLTEGEIVLVQGMNSVPQIALLLSSPSEGCVSLVADQWKAGQRPQNLVQMIPGIRREEWLASPPQEAKQRLQDWRKQLNNEWVDLLQWWEACQGQPFTFATLCEHASSEDQKLIWGLELLSHGKELFTRSGMTWAPLSKDRVLGNAGFAHHLELLHAGAGTPVVISGQSATLTGRNNWSLFEIRWDESGQVVPVKRQNIRLATVQE